MMTSREIRQKFLNYFNDKAHEIVPSAPIVIKDDPTLMFTNAGMNQFKDVFLGNAKPKSNRIADTQKCLRVSGKHNDLEEVGHDTYHHTMFEMLGNWSFGDYFKKEAIEWAWELLTEVYGIDKELFYVTIFEGNENDNLKEDSEAFDIWNKLLPAERILKFDKKDNFWEMGDQGPCGPCSEIHVDLRTEEEKQNIPAQELVNKDHPQVIEVWNLVFIQYNRSASGKLTELPAKHIDTGLGFERLCMVLQGKTSNYDTDVFQPLINKISKLSGVAYGKATDTDIALRVIADHVRAVAFAIADGQIPGNTGAGYVIKRILRRAIRYAYSHLDLVEPFLYKLVDILTEQMGDTFPEIKSQKDIIEKVIHEEEISFLRTLENGLKRIEGIKRDDNLVINRVLNGKAVFELYDTYGFPVDLTRLIVEEEGLSIDEEGFKLELNRQKERSKADAAISFDDWEVLIEDDREEFIGYDYLESDVKITRYRKVETKGKAMYQLVFNLTPFYPEGGGQVGDSGYIESNGEKISIKTTKKENNLIIHFTDKLPTDINKTFKAVVNSKKQNTTASNHTATHLMHLALREVLGTHVEQKGSLVHPDYLRFDFSHFSKVSNEELQQIEAIVNERIRANLALEEERSMPMENAMEMGAMALFGEKYGDVVRVIKFGDSVELCGGIHQPNTGNIGVFKIVSESSIAAGIRRIEAITGQTALNYLNEKDETIKVLKELISQNDVLKGVKQLSADNNRLKKEIEQLQATQTGQIKSELKQKIESVGDVSFIGAKLNLSSAEAIKNLAFSLKKEVESLFLVIGAEINGKANLSIMISENLVAEKQLNAVEIIKEVAKEIQGGGGGQAFYATAGGKNSAGIDKAIEKAKMLLQEKVKV